MSHTQNSSIRIVTQSWIFIWSTFIPGQRSQLPISLIKAAHVHFFFFITITIIVQLVKKIWSVRFFSKIRWVGKRAERNLILNQIFPYHHMYHNCATDIRNMHKNEWCSSTMHCTALRCSFICSRWWSWWISKVQKAINDQKTTSMTGDEAAQRQSRFCFSISPPPSVNKRKQGAKRMWENKWAENLQFTHQSKYKNKTHW